MKAPRFVNAVPFIEEAARASRPKRDFEWFERAQGRRPDVQWCAECRRPCVRAHTSGLAVGSASKPSTSTSRALRLASAVGSSHSLARVLLTRRFVLGRYYSARRKLCNLTKAAATAQPLRRGNTCVDSVAHPTASTSRHVVAPKAIDLQESVGATLRPTAA